MDILKLTEFWQKDTKRRLSNKIPLFGTNIQQGAVPKRYNCVQNLGKHHLRSLKVGISQRLIYLLARMHAMECI